MTAASTTPRAVDVHVLPAMLTALRLPSFHRHWPMLAERADTEGWPAARFLAALAEVEIAERETRRIRRHLIESRLPGGKTLATFDFKALPSVPRARIEALAAGDWIETGANLIAIGNSGTGKTHIACGIGLAACQRGVKTRFATAAAIVHEMIEAQDDKRLLRLQKTLAGYGLLVIDELGFVPLSRTGAELLFELISQRYERGATIITSNLPFDEWTATFGDERLTGALLDRLTHHVHILEMNGPSYRLAQSRSRKRSD